MIEYNEEVYNNGNDKKFSILSPVLMESINKIIEAEGYLTFSTCIKDISTNGGNYMSLLKEVDIKGKTVNDNKETNLFIKQCLPESNDSLLSPKELFSKELFFYNDVAELFTKLQNEFNVPDAEKFEFVQYYNESNIDSIILDNMTRKGFKIYNRFDVTPIKIMELSVRELAKFHGFSMVLKQYKPNFYMNKIQTKKYPFIFNERGRVFLKSIYNITSEYLEENRKTKVMKSLPELLDKQNGYLHKNECRVKCLCHGDYRMNNILIKEMNGEASKVIPIDYQLIYYGSPVLDLIYIIFVNTNQQNRKDYMEDLKEMYYESLTKFLLYFKIDVKSIYPQDEFENDFKNQLDYGLMISLTLLPFVLASEDDVPELSDEIKPMKLNDKFKPRIEEIVDDFIEWGYL